MLLMEMAGLESMRGYYDYARGSIDYESLIHRLSRMTHSLPFKTLLAEMLEYDPEERIGLLSLKEKVHKLRAPEQSMARSRSSKMLQEIMSHSRRSSSITRQSERSGSLSRQPSSDKKAGSRIETRPSKRHESEEPATPLLPLSNRNDNVAVRPEENPSRLKDLVKNKLSRGRESRQLKSFRQLPEPKQMVQGRPGPEQSGSSASSMTSKENRQGVRTTLNRLVEESGMKKLLRL
jgi:hypothetical protein